MPRFRHFPTLLCAIFTACSSDRSGGAAPLVYYESYDPRSLDPALSTDVPTGEMVTLLYDGLTRFDANGALQPALADRWSVDATGLRYVFHLRPGVKFHDGSALTADAVRRSFLRVLDPKSTGGRAWPLLPIDGASPFAAGATNVGERHRRPGGHGRRADPDPAPRRLPQVPRHARRVDRRAGAGGRPRRPPQRHGPLAFRELGARRCAALQPQPRLLGRRPAGRLAGRAHHPRPAGARRRVRVGSAGRGGGPVRRNRPLARAPPRLAAAQAGAARHLHRAQHTAGTAA